MRGARPLRGLQDASRVRQRQIVPRLQGAQCAGLSGEPESETSRRCGSSLGSDVPLSGLSRIEASRTDHARAIPVKFSGEEPTFPPHPILVGGVPRPWHVRRSPGLRPHDGSHGHSHAERVRRPLVDVHAQELPTEPRQGLPRSDEGSLYAEPVRVRRATRVLDRGPEQPHLSCHQARAYHGVSKFR